MIYDVFESTGHILEQGAHHRSVPGTYSATRSTVAQAPKDLDAETDLGAVAELGYD